MAYFAARPDVAVDTQAGRLRFRVMGDPAGLQAIVLSRIFGHDPRLDGVPVASNISLGKRQTFARGYAELPLNQIDPSDHLRLWMFDLKPGIRIEEKGSLRCGIDHELHRTHSVVGNRSRTVALRFDAGASSMSFW